jgi:hypothetical protein
LVSALASALAAFTGFFWVAALAMGNVFLSERNRRVETRLDTSTKHLGQREVRCQTWQRDGGGRVFQRNCSCALIAG